MSAPNNKSRWKKGFWKMGEVGGHILETVGEEMMQVWSETQFCSVDFSKSRIGVKKSAFLTNAQSRFVSVVVDGALGPPRLARHT